MGKLFFFFTVKPGKRNIKKPQYHSENREQLWADRKSGCSANFWCRAEGWFVMALVDVLDFLPSGHKDRDALIEILASLIKSLIKFRDPERGV
ncbi:MAG: glycoside hydrolase family 88 protein [Spirochaetales bacterium]|nr:glycoside hydrolase family 88 protein [Spirochaetales bacterium]